LWGCFTTSHNGCTHLHSYQRCAQVPFSQHTHQHLFVIFLTLAILRGVKWYFNTVLICIFLVISNDEHFFKHKNWSFLCFLWGNTYSGLSTIFKASHAFLVLSCMSSLHVGHRPQSNTEFAGISPIRRLPFHSAVSFALQTLQLHVARFI
jgi:hypothetical protein